MHRSGILSLLHLVTAPNDANMPMYIGRHSSRFGAAAVKHSERQRACCKKSIANSDAIAQPPLKTSP